MMALSVVLKYHHTTGVILFGGGKVDPQRQLCFGDAGNILAKNAKISARMKNLRVLLELRDNI